MTTDSKITPYSKMKTTDLRVLLNERGIDITPLNDDDGKLIRKLAYAELTKWDELNPTPKKNRKVRVIFHKTGDEASAPYVYLAVGNKNVQIPYEKEAVIDEMFLEVANHARRKEYHDSGKTDASKNIVYKEVIVHTCPYTFIEYVDEED